METDIDLHVITYNRQLLEQVLSNLVLEHGWNGKNPLKLAVEKVRALDRNNIFIKALKGLSTNLKILIFENPFLHK